ncbi:hypothetical protein K438DRAFT_1436369, partial [Mycena galopus ATCC 62051]
HERFWVSMQPFLLAQGYQLQPRYDPDWIPSWIRKIFIQELRDEEEDTIPMIYDCVLDATRICDGKKVILKRVETNSQEIEIMKYLNHPSVRDDPRNRTIKLLDIIPAPQTFWSFLVMPYCRVFKYPPFHCGNEFVEAMCQFLEGLQFMHENNIVH